MSGSVIPPANPTAWNPGSAPAGAPQASRVTAPCTLPSAADTASTGLPVASTTSRKSVPSFVT
ncbi:hypothetical protein BJF78_08080 [Pseudonocardia sp. CNS-139]|nr:hypothetical protein BJF78_08080 [Pseudonocardia sp. CNS-139]